jgi:hypothetical protein
VAKPSAQVSESGEGEMEQILEAVRFARMESDPVARANYLLEAVEMLVDVIATLQGEIRTLRPQEVPANEAAND